MKLTKQNLLELVRFYQGAAVNTVFGLGFFAFLIAIGVNLYIAQTVSFIAGVTFNYFVYSRHVFRTGQSAKLRFIGAYGISYLLNISLLWVFDQFTDNNYIAGFGSAITAGTINYFVLKYLVFARRKAQ